VGFPLDKRAFAHLSYNFKRTNARICFNQHEFYMNEVGVTAMRNLNNYEIKAVSGAGVTGNLAILGTSTLVGGAIGLGGTIAYFSLVPVTGYLAGIAPAMTLCWAVPTGLAVGAAVGGLILACKD